MNAGTKHNRDFEEDDKKLLNILNERNEPLKRKIISENLKDMIRRSQENLNTDYAEYLRGYGFEDQIERIDKEIKEKNQKEITSLKDIYIIGLENMEVNKKQLTRDALKGIRVQYNNNSEEIKQLGAQKWRLEQIRKTMDLFPNWQERDLKDDFVLRREDEAKALKNVKSAADIVRDHALIQSGEL